MVHTYKGALFTNIKKKRKKILTWMNLENTRLNETASRKEDQYCLIPVRGGTRESSQIHRDRNRMVVAKGQEGKMGKLLFSGWSFNVAR